MRDSLSDPVAPRGDRRWRTSLRVTIAVTLAAMVALTAAGIIGATWVSTRSSSLVVSSTLLAQITAVTEERVDGFLRAPAAANELVLRDLQEGALDPGDRDALEARFHNTLVVFDSLAMMAFADEYGDFLMVRRMPDGALWTKDIHHDSDGGRRVLWSERLPGASRTALSGYREDRSDTYDARTRPWYRAASDARQPVWTDVYVFFTDKAPGMTAAVPYVDGEALVGVLAVDVSLQSLSTFLARLDVSEHGRAYLVDRSGHVIGDPDPDRLVFTDANGDLALRRIDEAGHFALAALGTAPAFTAALERRDDAEVAFRFEAGGEPWLAAVRPVQGGHGDWLIAVVAPEGDFLGDVRRLARDNLATALFFTLAAVILSLLLARRIAGTLQRVVEESDRVRALQFDGAVDTHSPFREVHDVLEAFDGMKRGLRSLQRYTPMRLVRVLLEADKEPELGGELIEVSILFSDIAGFTTISERLPPDLLAQRLGTYLGALTRAIQARQGTVAHYIGDGVLAFWGAPIPVPDHAAQACQAAVACADIVRGLWPASDDAPPFHTRFGVHTARVTVGHFGTEERMAYTALGDGVNLASRLEGLGKYYGTTPLISSDTHERVAGRFEVRLLDLVRVKGRAEAVGVYELLGASGEVPPERLAMRDTYEAAFRLYRLRRWDEATAGLDELLERQPDDRPGQLLRARCIAFAKDPPPDGWRGAHTMTTK